MRRSLPAACLAVAAALASAACGGGGGGGGGAPFGLDARVPVTTLTFPVDAPTAGSVELYDGFPAVRFSLPVAVAAPPGDAGRVFVVEQGGRVRVVPNSPAATASQVKTFLDLTSTVTAGGEMGLLGLAFDPGYATNRRFYVCYTTGSSLAGTLRSVVARYQASAADPDAADPTTATVLLEQPQPFENHNGGCVQFGPDGHLYVSFGDGGSAGDPQRNAQDLTTWLGKILRLDVNGTSEGAYGVPADNPFVGAGPELDEIWAYGFRNPWRFAFDRGTGRLWAGDVGQDAWEEIDVVVRGGNYGWRKREGFAVYDAGDPSTGPFEDPVHAYGRTLGNVVTGGIVYRGTAVPFLVGHYVYADYGSGRVWALGYDGSEVTSNVQLTTRDGISAFGEDGAGELLACDHGGGRLWRARPTTPGTGTFPQTVSETGIYANLATLLPSPGLVPYDVQAPLWSDGAQKHRLVALPGDETVDWSRDGAWDFPVGTALVKTFSLPLVVGVPSSAVKVETRVLLRTSNGWEGYSYRWRDDQSDADLLPDGDARALEVSDPSAPGGTRTQTWTFPSRSDCLRCHTAAAGRVLGLTTRQMNRTFDYAAVGGTVDNQLRTWAHVGMFSAAVPAASTLPAHPDVGDASAPLRNRARAYLDANCSMCHRPGGPTSVAIDLRSTVSVAAMGVVDAPPQAGGLGLADPRIVDPGDRANSVLWLRMESLSTPRMPPLASSVVDADGSALVGQWIDEGP